MKNKPNRIKFYKRIDEEIQKFSEQADVQYEDTEAFAEWIMWFSMQQQHKEITDLIKNI